MSLAAAWFGQTSQTPFCSLAQEPPCRGGLALPRLSSTLSPTESQRARACLQDPKFPVEAVEAVLLWNDPWLSARVFGAGLYALICWAQLAKGSHVALLTVLCLTLRFGMTVRLRYLL